MQNALKSVNFMAPFVSYDMKFLNYLLNSLEADVYPYRIPIIITWLTTIVAMILGYFTFIK